MRARSKLTASKLRHQLHSSSGQDRRVQHRRRMPPHRSSRQQEHSETSGARAAAARPQSTHLVDHVLQLRLGRVLPQRPHHRAQLLGGDGALQAASSRQAARGRGNLAAAAVAAARAAPPGTGFSPASRLAGLQAARPTAQALLLQPPFKTPGLLGHRPAALTSPAAGGGGRCSDQKGGPAAIDEHARAGPQAPPTPRAL